MSSKNKVFFFLTQCCIKGIVHLTTNGVLVSVKCCNNAERGTFESPNNPDAKTVIGDILGLRNKNVPMRNLSCCGLFCCLHLNVDITRSHRLCHLLCLLLWISRPG